MSTSADEELAQRAAEGSEEAFNLLVERFQSRVIAHCYYMLSGESEDAAQEVFLKAYRGLRSFRVDATFSTWLFRICSNHCKDVLRKRRVRSFLTFGLHYNEGESGNAWEVSKALTGTSGETYEQRELLIRVLGSLPKDDREILLLKEYHGMSYQEIADTLGISVDAVKGRIKRARVKSIENYGKLSGEP